MPPSSPTSPYSSEAEHGRAANGKVLLEQPVSLSRLESFKLSSTDTASVPILPENDCPHCQVSHSGRESLIKGPGTGLVSYILCQVDWHLEMTKKKMQCVLPKEHKRRTGRQDAHKEDKELLWKLWVCCSKLA